MNIQTKKLRGRAWEMHLIYEETRWSIGASEHDEQVDLLVEELANYDPQVCKRMAWDRWFWYDQKAMENFITYLRVKYADK